MHPTMRKPNIEREAQGMADHLIDHIDMGNGDWNPGIWEAVFAAVRLVGDDAREAAPYAALIYQRYVVIAALYLAKFPDKEAMESLVGRIKSDMKSFTHYRKNMKADAFTEEESCLLDDAEKKINETLEVIDR